MQAALASSVATMESYEQVLLIPSRGALALSVSRSHATASRTRTSCRRGANGLRLALSSIHLLQRHSRASRRAAGEVQGQPEAVDVWPNARSQGVDRGVHVRPSLSDGGCCPLPARVEGSRSSRSGPDR